MKCRFCQNEVTHILIDLLNAPTSNDYLTDEELSNPETFYPLKVLVCDHCFLVQIDEYHESNELFSSDYAYFSSMSSSWVDHAKRYVEMITTKKHLNQNSQVIEIASNDGYLLQFFKSIKIPCLGVEPTSSTANVARSKGIDIVEDFFGENLAKTLPKADLIIGNNVLAHIPNINDFVKGLKVALKEDGIITMEFPHFLNLLEKSQFDTIYHEHFSYLTLTSAMNIFQANGLQIYDIEELQTHGGSLRIYATHIENHISTTLDIKTVLEKEAFADLDKIKGYEGFQEKANKIKYDFLNFLLHAKAKNKKVAAYGAAAKGNTLLNYCGIKNDLIDFVVDKSPLKIGKYLPGSHIPIVTEKKIKEMKPDYIVIFPWNIKDEIINQLKYIKDWNGKFIVAIPSLEIL